MSNGQIGADGRPFDECLQAISGIAGVADLDISGESGIHIADGYLVVNKKWSGAHIIDVMNPTGETKEIVIESLDEDVTIPIPAYGRISPICQIHKVKVAGTDDGLLVYLQKTRIVKPSS